MGEIVVPELGESVVDATVARWLKKVGEPVKVGEILVELETDKVDLEVGATQEGTLSEIRHQEGEDVKVGEVLGLISEKAVAAPAGEPSRPAPQKEEQPSAEKAPEIQAPAPPSEQARPGAREAAASEKATPVARRYAETVGVDLSQVQPVSPGEPIRREDIERFLKQKAQQVQPSQDAKQAQAPSSAPPPTRTEVPEATTRPPAEPLAERRETTGDGRREERVRMSRRRRTIAARLVEAQQTAAMLTTFNDVDMSAIVELRKRRRDSFLERHGVKLGFMSFFVKAAIGALKEFPQINAEIQGDEIVLKHYYDIGIAVGSEEGLVVPVLRDAGRMTFADIEKKIQDFTERTRQGALTLEDLRGGTFTITNGGVFGSLLSTPILNPPQVGILGLHRIEDRPVAVDGQVAIRPMMYLALSYDHRLVDGREAVQFLVRLKELVQDPESLLLEG